MPTYLVNPKLALECEAFLRISVAFWRSRVYGGMSFLSHSANDSIIYISAVILDMLKCEQRCFERGKHCSYFELHTTRSSNNEKCSRC